MYVIGTAGMAIQWQPFIVSNESGCRRPLSRTHIVEYVQDETNTRNAYFIRLLAIQIETAGNRSSFRDMDLCTNDVCLRVSTALLRFRLSARSFLCVTSWD